MSTSLSPLRSASGPRYGYTVLSVALVLFLLGLYGLLFAQGRRIVQLAKEGIEHLVELRPGTDEAARRRLIERLKADPRIKTGSIALTTREEAAALMRAELGDALTQLGLDNPFYDIISFNLYEAHLTDAALAALDKDLTALPAVQGFYYQSNLIGDASRNLRRIGWAGGILGLLLLAMTLFLLHHTVRLALHADRVLLKNMQLVGARWSFIRRPYLRRALVNALLSSLLAIGLLALLLWALVGQLPELAGQLPVPTLIALAAGLTGLSLLVNGWSTYTVVNRYLRLRYEAVY